MKNDWDEKLAVALGDVPVPEGLADRILKALKDQEPFLQGEKVRQDEDPAGEPSKSQVRASSASPKQVLLGAGLLAALAASLVMAVWLGIYQGEELSESVVLDEAIRSFDPAIESSGSLLGDVPGPADFPFSESVLLVRGTRWHILNEDLFGGRSGVVYELPGPGRTRAVLYSVETGPIAGFDNAPALHPFTTAGCSASVWQEGGMLYVLVVQGDPSAYRAYLNLPRDPVA
jgi:hypothetical protein